jgi:NADH-quinone oxidoreductase subunit A
MPGEYLPIAVLITLATGLSFLVVVIGNLFGPKRPNPIKSQPYESGMKPYGPGRRRVSVHFYLIAVLFILFDIEIVFLLPWAVVLRELNVAGLIEMGIFMLVLLVGLIYAWKIGALEWE